MKLQPNDRPERSSVLSALFDGEAEDVESASIVKAVMQEPELREGWRLYAMIGDQLRGDVAAAPDMTSRVMDRLRDEPVVLAPRRREAHRQHPFLALAASLAGVAVVGWLALADSSGALPVGEVAAVAPAPTFAQPAAVQVLVQGDMSEYLLAHHTQAASFRLGDSTEHVRTVSMPAGATRP